MCNLEHLWSIRSTKYQVHQCFWCPPVLSEEQPHLLGAHAGEGALPLDLLGDRAAQRVLRRRLLVLQVPPQLQRLGE